MRLRSLAIPLLALFALAGCGHIRNAPGSVARGVDRATEDVGEANRGFNHAAERLAEPLGNFVEGAADTIGSVLYQRNYDPNGTVFEGRIEVSGGEFKLFLDPVRNRMNGGACLSGALPRETLRTQRGLNGHRVRLTGQAVPWSIRGDAPTYQWRGTRVRNRCDRQDIILADTVEVLD